MFSKTSAAALALAGAALVIAAPAAQAYKGQGGKGQQQTRWQATSCVDSTGRRVVMTERETPNTAMAGRRPDGTPFMVFDPQRMAALHPVTRLFVFYHECAHHVLGHTAGNQHNHREIDADCWAIRHLQQAGRIDIRGIRFVQRDVSRWNGSQVHLPGPERAQHIGRCFQSATYRYGDHDRRHSGKGQTGKGPRDEPRGWGRKPGS